MGGWAEVSLQCSACVLTKLPLCRGVSWDPEKLRASPGVGAEMLAQQHQRREVWERPVTVWGGVPGRKEPGTPGPLRLRQCCVDSPQPWAEPLTVASLHCHLLCPHPALVLPPRGWSKCRAQPRRLLEPQELWQVLVGPWVGSTALFWLPGASGLLGGPLFREGSLSGKVCMCVAPSCRAPAAPALFARGRHWGQHWTEPVLFCLLPWPLPLGPQQQGCPWPPCLLSPRPCHLVWPQRVVSHRPLSPVAGGTSRALRASCPLVLVGM